MYEVTAISLKGSQCTSAEVEIRDNYYCPTVLKEGHHHQSHRKEGMQEGKCPPTFILGSLGLAFIFMSFPFLPSEQRSILPNQLKVSPSTQCRETEIETEIKLRGKNKDVYTHAGECNGVKK